VLLMLSLFAQVAIGTAQEVIDFRLVPPSWRLAIATLRCRGWCPRWACSARSTCCSVTLTPAPIASRAIPSGPGAVLVTVWWVAVATRCPGPAARVFTYDPDLWQPGRRDDRAFLFLAGRPRNGYRRGAQRRAGGTPEERSDMIGKWPRGRRAKMGRRKRRMSGLMQGKRGLIMGLANDKSLAWGIAKKLREHGAELAFSYQGEALEKRVRPLAASLGSDFLIECDVSDMESLDAAFATLRRAGTTIDFVVHAIGFSDKNELRGQYVDTSLDNFLMTMNISAYSWSR
jgi:hypothetical protein